MAVTTQKIRVDLNTGKVIPVAYTHQNDSARTFIFDMYNEGLPYSMTGNTVKFAYKSPIVNGQYTVIAGASMASGTVSDNTVSVTLPAAYTAISGVGLLTMIITPSSGTIRPVNIKFIVQKSADGNDSIAGASDFPAALDEIAENWLDENISIQIDDTLSVSGKAADAKVTGDEINDLDGKVDDLKSDLSVIDYKNSFEWKNGAYTNRGSYDPNVAHANRTTDEIINTDGYNKIVISPGTDRQINVAYYDKETNEFVSRTSWSQTPVVVDLSYNIRINIATITLNETMTTEEVLSQISIYVGFDFVLPKNVENLQYFFDSIFEDEPIVVQGWNQAIALPQTYYASYYDANLEAGDTITAKTGYQVGLTNDRTTLVPWRSTITVTEDNVTNHPINIVIRRIGAESELIVADNGSLLSTYIEESYTSNKTEQKAHVIYGDTLYALLSSLEIPEDFKIYKWKNKKAAFIGDSITAGVHTTQGNIYYQLLNDMIGFSSVYADGVAGSCYSATSNYGTSINPIVNRWSNIPTDCDLVVIFAGTNDWGHNTPLGTIADTTDVSFYGAISVVINGILEANPDVRLVLFTPLHRWGYTGGAYENDTQENGQGHTLKDYVDAIKDIAELYGVPVLDLFSIACLNPRISAIKTNYVTDGLHPNAAGHKILAERIEPMLETL